MRLLTSLLAVWLLCCAPGTQALADKRVALVIGNSAYRTAQPIDTAVKDAAAIAEQFRQAGFESVDLETDVGVLKFRAAVRGFEATAEGADVAVVYFAGHGIEIGGANYLVPVDADLQNIVEAWQELVPLDRIVSTTVGAGKLRLVVLDACRDIIPAPRIRRENGQDPHLFSPGLFSPGLGRVEPVSQNTLIAYASKAGATAADPADPAGDHSPFTTALLKSLTVPGLDIRLAFGRVRDDVRKSTDGRQQPFVYGAISSGIVSLVQAPSEPKPADLEGQKQDYELVANINTLRAWRVFIETHKTGFYVDLALAKLKALDDGPVAKEVLPRPTAPDPAEKTR
jgi:uncharacterized caspase-like protein